MHCGHSWGTWRDSSSKRPKWDSRYYLFVLVHTLEATFVPPPTLLAPTFDARRPDPSIEHGEETLSVLRHLLLSSPRELLEELRPTVSSILRLCCCYMTGGVLSSEWTNVHPTSPPSIHMFIYCTFYFACYSCVLSKPPKDTFPNAYTSFCGLFLSFLGKLRAHCLSCCMRCVQIIS